MSALTMGNSLWQLIMVADAMSTVVLLVLLSMSIACWTIFFYKLIMLRLKQEQMSQALATIKTINTVPELITLSSHMSRTLPGYFLAQSLSFLKYLIQRRELEKTTLSSRDWEIVQQHMSQTFDELMQQEEWYMPILHASAGVATLIGLFGTVWGLIHAFIRITEKQSADIATIAPGIAEALITTLVGLIVAIPAYLMFYYLTVRIRNLEHRMSVFVERYSWIIKQLFT